MKILVKLFFAAIVLLGAQAALAQAGNPQQFDINVDFDPFANFIFNKVADPTANDIFAAPPVAVTLGTASNTPAPGGLNCGLDIDTVNDFSLDNGGDSLTTYSLAVAGGPLFSANGNAAAPIGPCDFAALDIVFAAVTPNRLAPVGTYSDTVTMTLTLVP